MGTRPDLNNGPRRDRTGGHQRAAQCEGGWGSNAHDQVTRAATAVGAVAPVRETVDVDPQNRRSRTRPLAAGHPGPPYGLTCEELPGALLAALQRIEPPGG